MLVDKYLIELSLQKTIRYLQNPKCYIRAKKTNLLNNKSKVSIKRQFIFKKITFDKLQQRFGNNIKSYFEKYLDIRHQNKNDIQLFGQMYQLICISSDNTRDLKKLKTSSVNIILSILNIHTSTMQIKITKNNVTVLQEIFKNYDMSLAFYYSNTSIQQYTSNINLKQRLFNGVLGQMWFYNRIRNNSDVIWVNKCNQQQTDDGYDLIVNNIKINVKTISSMQNKIPINYGYDKCNSYVLLLINKIQLYQKYDIQYVGYIHKKDIINNGRSYIYLNSSNFKKDEHNEF